MLMFEPNKDLMHNYSGMGLGGGTGLGIDPFITNKQVVFMGDSTFFHSGQLAISNSIKNGQDITYVILDNKTTAMTGQQTTAALEYDLLGNETFVQKIEKIIEAMVEAQDDRGHPHQPRPARRLPHAARVDHPEKRREGRHRRQGMRHHLPSPPQPRRARRGARKGLPRDEAPHQRSTPMPANIASYARARPAARA